MRTNTSTLVWRKEGFLFEPFPVRAAGLRGQDHDRNGVDEVAPVVSPPTDGAGRLAATLRGKSFLSLEKVCGDKLFADSSKAKSPLAAVKRRGLARRHNILALTLIGQDLKRNIFELSCAQYYESTPLRLQLSNPSPHRKCKRLEKVSDKPARQ